MRLIFLGSPEPVIAPLKTLLDTAKSRGDEVVAVVSQPARPVGRGGKMADPPVAAYAKTLGITTLQPEKASDPDFLAAFAALKPDLAITAAYGQILPSAFLSTPRRGTINIHPSLLPKYRGAIPVPASLLAGDEVSGVSVLFTVQRLDAGAIIVQESLPIGPDETSGALTTRYFEASGPLVLRAIDKLRDPSFTGTPQDETAVTHCRKIDKNDGEVDWTQPAVIIYRRFRAFEPWPGSFTHLADRRLGLVEIKAAPSALSSAAPGAVSYDKKDRVLRVATGEGQLLIHRLKPAGGKVITAEAFWNGLKDRERVQFTKVAP
ncbi:MAG: methionyl-tRNA formyltransferase [Deltaproteobacteria bacterium]|nr:methionyl-tRNA formyltransferase [Deltaproteobacteria bacterium]